MSPIGFIEHKWYAKVSLCKYGMMENNLCAHEFLLFAVRIEKQWCSSLLDSMAFKISTTKNIFHSYFTSIVLEILVHGT